MNKWNIRGNFFIFNNELKESKYFDNKHIIAKISIYEVLQISKYTPLFGKLHYERLQNSGNLTGISIPTYHEINIAIEKLVKINDIENGNIEIIINSKLSYSCRFIQHHYPTHNDYQLGVKTMLYEANRINPNAKIKYIELRKKADTFIKQNNIYEAIYHHNTIISEGSRSNIFFIKDNTVYTSSLNNVLPGITRQVIIKILINLQITVIQDTITTNEIRSFSSAFLTGTSPKVLPINSIDNQYFDVNNAILRHIMSEYDKYTMKNIDSNYKG